MLGDAEVQRAIVERLSGDATLAHLMGQVQAQVFDYVPEHTEFPYFTYQQVQVLEDDTTTTNGFVVIFAIHVWSQYEGTKESHTLLQRVYELLHEKYDFTLSGYQLINLRYQFSEVMRDPDGQTYHGVARYRAVVDSL